MATGPILLDGGMGTRLIARGLDLKEDDPALWVIDRDDEVLAIHQNDIAAGSDALLTDTFGASRGWLERFGRDDDTRTINERAVGLARQAAGSDRFVIGSIGAGASAEPLREQAEILVESGVDALILETFSLPGASDALVWLRDWPVPILASLYDWPEALRDSAHRLIDRGAAAIGANCQNGMGPAVDLARRLRDVTDHPLLMKPSAGLPGPSLIPPRIFEAAVPKLVDCGVRLIGGCCGTAEAHVAAMRKALDDLPKNSG